MVEHVVEEKQLCVREVFSKFFSSILETIQWYTMVSCALCVPTVCVLFVCLCELSG